MFSIIIIFVIIIYEKGKCCPVIIKAQGRGMNESYAEYSIKRRQTAKDYFIKLLMIFLTLFMLVFGGSLIGAYSITVAVALGVVCFFWFPRMNLEYEYVYCDGQLDFDRISGNAKRKTVLRIDFEKVEIVAPVNSHALDPFNNNPQLKVKDFSSLAPDKNVYALILRDEVITKILFEPNEKMLDCMKQKTPRKISAY